MKRKPTAYDLLAARLREIAREEASAVTATVERWTVVQSDPLVIESEDGDVRLEEGDPDVEWSRHLLAEDGRPEVGDVVRVDRDRDGDYIVTAILDDGGDDE